MLEKLAIDPVRNPNSSYMKSLGMTAEEASTSTWTAASPSDPLQTGTAAIQPRPAVAYTTRAGKWGKKSAIPLKEEPIADTPSLAEVSDPNVSTKLQTSSWPKNKSTPANTSVPAMPVKSFASAAAAAPRTEVRDKTTIVPARQSASTYAWNHQATPSAPTAAAAHQSLKVATTNTNPVTSKKTQQESLQSATATEWNSSTSATERESAITPPRSTQKWDMPQTASWETFGTQAEDSIANHSDASSLKSTPVSTASYAQSVASTNTEPCSPMSPVDVTAGLGSMTIGSCRPQVIYSAEEWQAITDKGRDARRGRYYGQPNGGGSGGKRGGW